MSDSIKNTRGLSGDKPVIIGKKKKEKSRKDEFRRRAEASDNNSSGGMQQPLDNTPLKNPNETRKGINAVFDVASEDFKKDFRSRREQIKIQEKRSQQIDATVSRSIDQMIECIHQGKEEEVTRTLQNLKDSSPNTYQSLKKEIDKRHTDETNRKNKDNWEIILGIFSEKET
jgi:hypothetical protein